MDSTRYVYPFRLTTNYFTDRIPVVLSMDTPYKLNYSLLLKKKKCPKLLMCSFLSRCSFPFIINDLCDSLDCGNYHFRLITLLFMQALLVLMKYTAIYKSGLISSKCTIMKPVKLSLKDSKMCCTSFLDTP